MKGNLKREQKYKRSEQRFETGDEAILQELHPLALSRHTVQITDVSKSGLGLVSAKSLLPGTIVQVRMGQTSWARCGTASRAPAAFGWGYS